MTSLWASRATCMVALGVVFSAGCVAVEDGREELERTAQVEQAEIFDPAVDPQFVCPVDTSDVSFERELLITSLDVVNDPCRTGLDPAQCANPAQVGKWSFGYLMQGIAGTAGNPSTLILKWLESFEETQTVNGQTLAARSKIRSYIIDPWRAVSKKPDGVTPCAIGAKVDAANGACNLDMAKAPFRLLAIVNRTDLREPGYGGGAGEARFVFGFTKMDGTPLDATVILEYALPNPPFPNLNAWASRFRALAGQPAGEKYNNALADITELFAKANIAATRPNGSAISQVRTAEIAFDGNATQMFEMREQRLQCRPNKTCTQYEKILLPSTLVLTPRNSFDFTPGLTSYMNNNMSAILSGAHTVPTSLLAASSRPLIVGVNPFGVWAPDAPLGSVPYPSTEGDVRRLFGFSTCNGCHSPGETNTNDFHIRSRAANMPSALSPFLQGETTIVEPITGETVSYNEPERRKCEHKWLSLGNLNMITTNAGRPH